MMLSCRIGLPDSEFERFLQLSHIEQVKNGELKDLLLEFGQEDQFQIIISRKRLAWAITSRKAKAKQKGDTKNFWMLTDEQVAKFPDSP